MLFRNSDLSEISTYRSAGSESDNLRKTIVLVIHSVDPFLIGQLILSSKRGNKTEKFSPLPRGS